MRIPNDVMYYIQGGFGQKCSTVEQTCGLAQWVERWPCNLRVAGSSPAPILFFFFGSMSSFFSPDSRLLEGLRRNGALNPDDAVNGTGS